MQFIFYFSQSQQPDVKTFMLYKTEFKQKELVQIAI